MTDKKENRDAFNRLIVEFVGSKVCLKRANGGPIIDLTHQEWHDIKMGKYDPQKKEEPAPK